MNWYYVEAGQQRGPITEAELDNLYATGKVQSDTLVWHEGAANWLPYGQAKGGTATIAAPPGGSVVCNECGGLFAPDEVIRLGNASVCGTCKPVFMQKMREGVAVGGGAMEYAGFWIRAGALIIDSIITNAISAVVGFVIGLAAAQAGPDAANAAALVASLVGMLLGLIYFVYFNGKFGATPGKMVCGIKIVTGEGYPIGYGRALGRYFASILSAMICLIGYIMAGFDDEKRTLHDRLCNTRVVKK
ncbi:MAG: RDD family protein [Limisphaerales bacterium]